MYLKDFMAGERVFCIEECTTKSDLINKMVDMIKSSLSSLNKEDTIHNLLEKEGVFSTGVGGGIAIPHAVVPGVDKTYLSIAQLKCGLDYNSVDNAPVFLVFMLLSPEGRTHEHIKLLARIARLCFRHEFVAQMRAAANKDELFKMVVDEDLKHPD